MQRTKANFKELKSKGNADGKPRYEAGTFPLYDREYLKACEGSVILNDAKRAQDFKYAGALNGLSGCRGSLYELQGIEGETYYKRGGNKYKALIPIAKDQLKNVHADFQAFQKSELKAGNSLKPPKNWPNNLLQERLKAEAKLDARRAELAKVKGRIHKLTAEKRKKKAEAEKLFPNGLTGTGADGQKISYKNDVAFIDDERSPYDKMTLFHYKAMVQDWLKEHEITDTDLNRRAKAYKQKMIDAGYKDEVPAMFTGKKFKDMMKRKSVWHENRPESKSWPEWDSWPEKPSWPEGVPTIKELETDEEE